MRHAKRLTAASTACASRNARPARFDGGGQSAARSKIPAHRAPRRTRRRNNIPEYSIHCILIKDAQVTVGKQIQFERLQLEARPSRLVLDADLAVVRHAGLGGYRSVFRKGRNHAIAGEMV